MTIIPYSPDLRTVVEDFLVDFQEHERGLEPTTAKTGKELAPEYLDWLLESCRDFNGQLLVAEVDGVPAGYICFWDEALEFFTIKSQLRICDLYVSPKFRGLGVGRRLLDEAERECKSRKHPRMTLDVLARNKNARDVYLNCGFREYEVTMTRDVLHDEDER